MMWIREYLGHPWIHGEHDCWAFFRRVQREKFQRDVPAIDVDSFNTMACVRAFTEHDERDNWIEIQIPADGDAVLMSQSRQPTHVGVWVNDGVLHCVRGTGVVFSSLRALKGFPYNVTGYYRAVK